MVKTAANAEPDILASDTLGWRLWFFNDSPYGLCSPIFNDCYWFDGELRVSSYCWKLCITKLYSAGIHALYLPIDWRHALWPDDKFENKCGEHVVFGIVERFGGYILGEFGWRAEWVVIKELQTSSIRRACALRRLYPSIPVHFDAD